MKAGGAEVFAHPRRVMREMLALNRGGRKWHWYVLNSPQGGN
jgi:hypothetical protein